MKKRSVFERFAGSPYVVWSALFIIAPLIFVMYFAFTDRSGSFTFENILSLSSYSETFVMSLGFSLIATTICLLIGFPLAYCMARTSERTRNILLVLLMLPMWISLLIRTYSLMALLDNGGLVSTFLTKLGFEKLTFIGTDAAVILGMIYDFLPYMVLPIYTTLIKLDKRYLEAAYDLGANNQFCIENFLALYCYRSAAQRLFCNVEGRLLRPARRHWAFCCNNAFSADNPALRV